METALYLYCSAPIPTAQTHNLLPAPTASCPHKTRVSNILHWYTKGTLMPFHEIKKRAVDANNLVTFLPPSTS